MSFSERILGKKNVNGGPHIETVAPALALTGGEVRIVGSGLRPADLHRPIVQFGAVEGSIVVSSEAFVVAALTPPPSAPADGPGSAPR